MGEKTVSSYAAFGRWSRKYSWWLIITMLVIAALLVVAGLVLIIIGKPEHQELLFKIAKILGAGGTTLGMLKAFWQQIREKYDLIRLQQTSGHIIICGLGDKGKLLMTTFTKEERRRVVIIETQKDHPGISGCKERNALVMIGDASDSVVLDEANAARAKYLFAVTGDDNTNIKIAQQGKLLAENVHKEDEKVSLRCYVHVASSSLRDVFARHELFARTYDYFDASIFNVFETAARVILEKYPPDIYARQQSLSGDAIPIVVIGFGRMGENIVKQAARIGHYATWSRLDISIVDHNIKESAEKFFAVYGDGKSPPSFIVPDVNINFIDRDPECLSSPADIIGTNGRKPVALYIALDDDSVAVSLALRVRMMLGSNATPIIVCMRSSLSDLMKGKEAQFTIDQNIHGFNILDAACGYQTLMEEIIDELARTIHSAYVNAQILFSQDDFTTSTPSDLLQSISRDNPNLQGFDEQQPIASLNQIMKSPVHKKYREVLNSKVKGVATNTLEGARQNKPFDQLTVVEQTQRLVSNTSWLKDAYPELYPAKKSENRALKTWEKLNEVMKDANRWSADHVSVKLRTICDGQDLSDRNKVISDLDKVVDDPEFIEKLARMEHRRWVAERLMDGWRYGQKRDDEKKIHHLLIPYEQLSVEERNKDKDMIQNIKNIVASPGWEKQLKFIR